MVNKMDPEFPCNWCSKINNEDSTNLGGTIIKWILNFDIIIVPTWILLWFLVTPKLYCVHNIIPTITNIVPKGCLKKKATFQNIQFGL